MDSHAYRVNLSWTKERRGDLSSLEIHSTIEVATPPNFPKGIEGLWSPEHLLTASVVSCLMTTFLAIAKNSRLEFTAFNVESKAILKLVDGKFLITKVQLFPKLEILSEKDLECEERIVQKSKLACLISNSIKAKVEMIPKIFVTQLA